MRASLPHRLFRFLIVLSVPAILLAAGLVTSGQAADFSGRVNLAGTSALSGPPDVETQGELVVAVWSEGYNDIPDTKDWGHVYLRTASELLGWWTKRTVMRATNDVWGIEPHFVFDASTPGRVHVVWAQTSQCGGRLTFCQGGSIRYTTCALSGGVAACQPPATIASTNLYLGYRTPDIAPDGDGDLHVVWNQTSSPEQLLYSRCAGNCTASASWSAPSAVPVSGLGENPNLAFSNGVLHLAWDEENPSGSKIRYYRDTNTENNTFDAGGAQSWGPAATYTNPSNPTLAAAQNMVYIAWDMQKTGSNPPQFALAHVVSNNNGTAFTSVRNVPNNSTSSFTARESVALNQTFMGGLKPSLTVTSTGSSVWAHLVWHEIVPDPNEGGLKNQQVFYSYLTAIATPWSGPVAVTMGGGASGSAASGQENGPADVIVQGIAVDSAEPDVAISQAGDAQVVCMEKVEDKWDAVYQGPIADSVPTYYLPFIRKKP